MSRAQYRQGDVLLVRLDESEKTPHGTVVPREDGRLVLAYGEATGHTHAVEQDTASLIRDPYTGSAWLIAPDGAVVSHEEHDSIELPAGTYRVKQQTEYTEPHRIRPRFMVD